MRKINIFAIMIILSGIIFFFITREFNNDIEVKNIQKDLKFTLLFNRN